MLLREEHQNHSSIMESWQEDVLRAHTQLDKNTMDTLYYSKDPEESVCVEDFAFGFKVYLMLTVHVLFFQFLLSCCSQLHCSSDLFFSSGVSTVDIVSGKPTTSILRTIS